MQKPVFLDSEQDILRFGQNANTFNVSSLNQFQKTLSGSGFAIKFVTQGIENYAIEKRHYQLGAGSYLLTNGEKKAQVLIDSNTNVKGFVLILTKKLSEKRWRRFVKEIQPNRMKMSQNSLSRIISSKTTITPVQLFSETTLKKSKPPSNPVNSNPLI